MKPFKSTWIGRSIVACLLVSLAAFSVGVPIPTSSLKSTTERFPCETRPCGCNSAAKCWEKCCCHTDEQKIAWAKKNNVAPPQFLIDRVAKNQITNATELAATSKKLPACCANKSGSSKTKSCCQVDDSKSPSKSAIAKAKSPKRNVKWVILTDFQNCQGLAALIQILSDCTPTQIANFSADPHPILERLTIGDESFCGSIDLVDGPVPRV